MIKGEEKSTYYRQLIQHYLNWKHVNYIQYNFPITGEHLSSQSFLRAKQTSFSYRYMYIYICTLNLIHKYTVNNNTCKLHTLLCNVQDTYIVIKFTVQCTEHTTRPPADWDSSTKAWDETSFMLASDIKSSLPNNSLSIPSYLLQPIYVYT